MKTPNQKAWWLGAPVVLLVAFNAVIPLMAVVNYSVHETFGNNEFFFEGVRWFQQVMQSARFREALQRQILFTGIVLAIQVPLGVAVRLLLVGQLPARPRQHLLLLPLPVHDPGHDALVDMGMINDTSNDFHLGPNISNSYLYVSNAKGRVGIGTKTPGHPLQLASGAHVSTGGVWTDASSRSFKQDIAELSLDDAATTLSALEPVTFAYTADPAEKYVGFIAEDVPALVATGDRKGLSPMDIVAVLTKVVQAQQHTIAELQARVEQLEKK